MRKINNHPTIEYTDEIQAICKPLLNLNINYFTHVNIDNASNFSAISTHPEFHKHYLKQCYYHADIHLSDIATHCNFILWDALESSGESTQMQQDAGDFKIRHTFTIVDKNAHGDNYYHFSTSVKENSFNQVYLSNLDLLKLFINYFNNTIDQASHLSKAYDIKFSLHENLAKYTLATHNISAMRSEFIQSLALQNSNSKNKSDVLVIHKDSQLTIPLSKQQAKCLLLLVHGHHAGEMAAKLHLSIRTINHYIEHIKTKLGCRNSKELIAAYTTQIMRYTYLLL